VLKEEYSDHGAQRLLLAFVFLGHCQVSEQQCWWATNQAKRQE
jgi:hypothetical protein